MQDNALLHGNVRSALIRFALPFLAASFLQFLYGAADMAVVGRFCDPAAIVAVSNGAQIMQILTLLVVGLTTGVTVLVGQFLGAGRREDMCRCFATGIWVFMPVSLAFLLLFFLSADVILRVMQVPEQAGGFARNYLRICAFGLPFITGYNLVSGALRAIGDSKRPMIFVAATCLFNIALDLLLVGALGKGVSGAAAATAISQALSLGLSLSAFRLAEFPFSPKILRPTKKLVARLLRIGFPMGLQNLLTDLSFLLITVILNRIGLEQSAAGGVVERILGFGFLGSIAFSSAISAMTAQNAGAGQFDRAKSATIFGLICSTVLGAVLYILFRLFDHALIGLFTDDAAVTEHARQYMVFYGVDCILVGFVFCLNGFFGGCGKAGFTMLNSLLSTFLVRVPLSYFISVLPGTTMLHLGLAAPAASLLQVILQLFYLRSGRWKNID